MAAPGKHELLIVDDHNALLTTLQDILVNEGYVVSVCQSSEEARKQCRENPGLKIAVIDLRLGDENGIGLLEMIGAERPDIRCIIHTAYGTLDSVKTAVNLGAFAYVEKLTDPRELLQHIHRASQAALEDALQASEQRFQTLVSSSPIGIHELELTGQFASLNPAATRIFSVEKESDLIGRTYLDLVSDTDRKNVSDWLHKTIEGQECEFQFRLANQSPDRIISSHFVPIRDQRDRVIKLMGISEDITKQENAKRALAENERSLAKAQEIARLANWELDLTTNSLSLSDQMNQIVGFAVSNSRMKAKELVKKFVQECVHPDDRERLRRCYDLAIESGLVEAMEFRITRQSDLQERYILAETEIELGPDNQPVRLMGTIQDITDRIFAEEKHRQKEQDLMHVSRLATMGELVAGIAHEINQPLFSITNFANSCALLLKQDPPDNIELVRDWLQDILEQSTRASEIIKRLAGFVRNDDPEHGPEDLNELVAISIDLTKFYARRKKVMIEADYFDVPIPVLADNVQIQQVIVNLIRNAVEAMETSEEENRRLKVKTILAEGFGRVELEDNGPGLPMDIRDNLFDAFVTTKKNGMGMGLAICRSIVQSHGGNLTAIRNSMGGATFAFDIPCRTGVPSHA